MLRAMSQWVRQIIMVVMFAAFVDFLIPENNFLRYVKVFLGLLVVIVMISPLMPFFNKDLSFEEIPFVYEDFFDNKSIISMSDSLNKINKELAIDGYKANIEKYISEEIAGLTLYNIKNVAVIINKDLSSSDFGKITQVKITLSENLSNGKSEQEKISIEKIKIGDKKAESSVFVENPNEEFKNIIEYLTENFDILEKNIYIELED
ncbi:MAG: stage III sporulation protein AF [Thermoanaerobacteraceae bacterium]|nr:stage III sporulation protein AF [Thermoanaerobacteraceae bacterium]